ncbi:MAG: hypothetical protein R3268_07680 [Acidiferrobacterales bacterium]|nr:hypothetical protein [Acidiferrobacterales bacterium]
MSNRFQDVHLDLQHFFARKVMFVKDAKAQVVTPGLLATWVSWSRP